MVIDDLLKGKKPEIKVDPNEVVAKNQQAPFYVVLDDDPTGTQSISDLPVITSWDKEDFQWAFSTGKPAVYVMTNSRSLSATEAKKVNAEVVRSALSAAPNDVSVSFISRSDSTLRGHYPLEPDTIADEIEKFGASHIDGFVIVSAFPDAGRITIDSTHYVKGSDDTFEPVGNSEFAKDATFGFESSSLPDWIEEKTRGKVAASDVITLDLDTLRSNMVKSVSALLKAKNRQPIVVDIVTENDLRILALALAEAETKGAHFVYRVGPPFVRARLGQEEKTPLSAEEVFGKDATTVDAKGGLIVIGSHVDLTTRQLNALKESVNPKILEVDVHRCLDPEERDQLIAEICEEACKTLQEENVVIQTSRELIKTDNPDESLEISRKISDCVVQIVNQIVRKVKPRFVIAKGGITSSDVASKGLEMKHATVLGPALPGIVSVWLAEDGIGKGIPYIVFAGNVGDEKSLSLVVEKLS